MSIIERKYTKAQEAFLQQRAQQELVRWCDEVMRGGDMKALIALDPNDPYVEYAAVRSPEWIKEKSPGQFYILGSGWAAAASFLKR